MSLLESAEHIARAMFLLALAGVGVRQLVRRVGGWPRVMGWIGAAMRARPW